MLQRCGITKGFSTWQRAMCMSRRAERRYPRQERRAPSPQGMRRHANNISGVQAAAAARFLRLDQGYLGCELVERPHLL